MKNIKKAIISVDYPAAEIESMVHLMDTQNIVICGSKDTDQICHALKDCEVAVLGRTVKNIWKYVGESLRWLHCDAAGLDSIYSKALSENGKLTVTCSSGRSSKALAEHVIMFMLSLNYRLNYVWEARKNRQWKMDELADATALTGKNVGILGVGSIGRELASRCKALEMHTIGYARTTQCCEGFDEIVSGKGGLKHLVEESDFLVSTIPLTDETYHLIDAKMISFMKATAFLVNISRGSVIDEKAMIKALKEHRIAGAGLDTFEHEPLEYESMLWDLKNVILTPHFTPPQPDKHDISYQVILDNIIAYREGKELKNAYKSYYVYNGNK